MINLTLIVSWLGVDSRWPTSAYIASDSRISWDSNQHFDFTRKVFAFNNYPDIMGYSGDVLFPSIVLSQIVEMADCGLLFKEEYDCRSRSQAIQTVLEKALDNYPNQRVGGSHIQIIHISREKTNNRIFFCNYIEWTKKNKWKNKEYKIPNHSSLLFTLGTGGIEFKQNYRIYQNGHNKSTSRNVFHCFCNTLFNTKDHSFGGAPQLVGIYSKPGSTGKKFGIIKDNRRFLFGAEIIGNGVANYDNIEWRNDLFEICDGQSMTKRIEAMEQPDNLRRL